MATIETERSTGAFPMKNDDKNISQGLKKGRAIQKAYERIKQLISLNQLVPGQKLIYADIADKVNMGVTPVIQALNRLETSGLVRYVANKGYFVGEITETEVRQLYQAREALEIFVIPAVIQNIDSQKLDKIANDFNKKDYLEQSRRALILDDIRFHLAIVRHAHNNVIYNLLKSIFEQVYLKYRPEYLDETRIKEVLREHLQLLTYLRNANEDEAIALVRDHIRSSIDYVVKTIKREKLGF